MKTILIIIAFLNVALTTNHAQANGQHCEWLGNAASVVAQNRENGLDEFDLIDHYLKQSQNYSEQKIILSLINRVYRTEDSSSPNETAFIERQRCEVALVNTTLLHNRK